MGKMDAPDIKETESQKELAKIAAAKWEISKETLQPLEDMLIADVSRGVTAEERAQISGQVGTAHQAEMGRAQTETGKALAAAGVDPTSGKAQESLSDLAIAGGESRAAAEAEGEMGLQAAQMQDELNLLRVGSGQSTQAQSSMTDVASRAASKATHTAQSELQAGLSQAEAVGSLAGMAGSYYATKKKPTDIELAKKHGVL